VRVACKHTCCLRSFLPLELSFARTIHRFQGLQAGPVDDGKIPNMFPRIVCDPDVKASEGKATGLFYTAISRATTLGDPSGLNSAIYFTGSNLTRERIQQLTLKCNTKTTLMNVQRREQWVQHLERNTSHATSDDTEDMEELFQWIRSNVIPYTTLFERTTGYINAKRRSPSS
jgi:hypothetical protein